MAFIIADDFRTISFYPGEPGYFTYQPCRADVAETPEPNLGSRAYRFTIWSPEDALVRVIDGIFLDGRFHFRFDGIFSRALIGRSTLKFSLVQRLSAGGKNIDTTGVIALGEPLPDSEDYGSAPAVRYVTHIRRINDPNTVARAPRFVQETVEYEPTTATPVNTAAPSISGTNKVGSTLTATSGSWSGAPALAYQWLRNGNAISGATSPTYLLISSDSAASITCRVTATNAGGSASATSAAVVIATQPVLSTLTLTSAAVVENSLAGIVVGQIAGRATGSTLSMTYTVGDRFALSGVNVVTSTTPTDYETATSHTVIVRETHPDASPSFRDTNLTITVTNSFEQPDLTPLGFSQTNFVTGVPSSGSITGAKTGSTVTASGLPSGLTINSVARTFAWDGTGMVGTNAVTLSESLGDSSNSPRSSTFNIAIVEPSPITAPVLTKTSATGKNPMSWNGFYADVVPETDYLRCRWKVGAGSAWQYETDRLITTDDFFDSEDGIATYTWPLFDSNAFQGGNFVVVQEGILRDGITAWSNEITDTMVAVVQPAHLGSSYLDYGYSSDPLTSAPVTAQPGDKVLITYWLSYNDARTADFTLRNAANNQVLTATDIGVTAVTAGDVGSEKYRMYQKYIDLPAGITTLTVTLDPISGGCQSGGVMFTAIRNAALGGPVASYFENRVIGGDPYHYTNGPSAPNNLVPGSNEAIVSVLSCEYDLTTPLDIRGATVLHPNVAAKMTASSQVIAGNVATPGNNYSDQPPATTTIGYQRIIFANTKWST